MRPIKVEFQAFGPYVGHEMVDFEAISSKGLFLICGKTGIGKTMILDAMTFALYGKSSGHGRDQFEAMRCTNADHDTNTFVKFVFENNGEYFCFERRLERKRKNLSASYNVSQKGEDGIWRPLMENAKEKAVNEKAVEIIGLEYEQFRQVIILPQGQFERLLTSNSDEKEKILTSIFGEEKWQAIADRFYEEAERRKSELKGIQERIRNSLRDENCESVSELEIIVAQKKNQEKLLDEEYVQADYDKIIQTQQEVLALVSRFGDLHKAEGKVEELQAQKEQREAWEKDLKDARRAEKVRQLLESERKAADALATRKNEEESAKKTAALKKKALEEAAENVAKHAAKEAETEAVRSRMILYEGKRQDYEGIEEAERELQSKQKAASKALKEEEKAKEQVRAFAERIVRLNKEYTELNEEHGRMLEEYLAGITGELADQLEDGKPCPVCGSREHPKKAKTAENSVTKAMVDERKAAADGKYQELQDQSTAQENAKRIAEEKHAAVEQANTEQAALAARLDSKKKNLVPGVESAEKLEEEIRKLRNLIDAYAAEKERLGEAEKKAKEACVEANAKIGSARQETEAAQEAFAAAQRGVEKGLEENHFASKEEAERLMKDAREMDALSARIADYDAGVKAAGETLDSLKAELKDKEEPDKEACEKTLRDAREAQGEYRAKKAVLVREIERLDDKVSTLRKEGEGIEERIREAESDFVFAKKLRGDSGTGLRRYVLGIMFSSVVAAANKMLEMVHGGRYRLYRSDEKAQGTNKRGLELKVFDRNSEEHDGRFVSTLSGGEKFLASLALSIGMSTVAQRGGIKIDALFIDEGFGSLDDESISDAMDVLNSIQEANGLVGIISHVQILQDQIPTKLRVEEDDRGSHIVQTVG